MIALIFCLLFGMFIGWVVGFEVGRTQAVAAIDERERRHLDALVKRSV